MDYLKIVCFALLVAASVATPTPNATTQDAKSPKALTVADLVPCGLMGDVKCFLDTADDLVGQRKTALLALADAEALKANGRADEENTPSQLSSTISKIISELSEMLRDGLSGLFKSGREAEDDDEVEAEEEEVEETDDKAVQKQKGREIGESRKKKKKGKLIGLIKLIILGVVIATKVTLLLKALSAALQVKFFLVALAGLILNAARFYLDLKKGHQPQKVIYYEHAQHQHHYEGGDEGEWQGSSPGGGGYWGRSYDEEEKSAQDLAFAKQKPQAATYSRVDNKPNYSWFGGSE